MRDQKKIKPFSFIQKPYSTCALTCIYTHFYSHTLNLPNPFLLEKQLNTVTMELRKKTDPYAQFAIYVH